MVYKGMVGLSCLYKNFPFAGTQGFTHLANVVVAQQVSAPESKSSPEDGSFTISAFHFLLLELG